MEILDIVDELGNPTGETVEREKAHQLGILHRTAHVWIVREKNHHIQVLLQRRSHNKDSFPDCYDISSAGHIHAGVDFVSSSLRELKEELGYQASKDELIDCGIRCFEFCETFHHKFFHDHQVSRIFLLWLDKEAEDFVLQEEEVSEVKWFDFDECYERVVNNSFSHCIYQEELDMIKKKMIMND